MIRLKLAHRLVASEGTNSRRTILAASVAGASLVAAIGIGWIAASNGAIPDNHVALRPSGGTTTTTLPHASITSPSNCGTANMAVGWPTTTALAPSYTQCMLTAFSTGRRATYRQVTETDGHGGHEVVTTLDVIGVRVVRETVNSAKAVHPVRLQIFRCTRLTATVHGLSASRCHRTSAAS